MLVTRTIVIMILFSIIMGCGNELERDTLFELLSAEQTGVDFQNTIISNDSINLMEYEYLYNGGGVGIGDFNSDGLPDIFFTSNQGRSRLYLNRGGLKFSDITESAGVETKGLWCTGVSIIDIDQDGDDDIYINVGGKGNKNDFPNLLYVNQGDNRFIESAASYGIDDTGESIQSVFFDYDRDGDLDMYLLTGGGFENSAINVRPMLTKGTRRNTDRLYRNDFDKELGHAFFTNVSKEAGITIEGFGLGVSVFDANNDKWPDLYVSNDYLSRDLLYVNNQDGTFSEEALKYFGHVSYSSMGNDIADINNDGLLDVFTLDMMPEEHSRRKLMSGPFSYDLFQHALSYGYGHQYMRNMLHHNNGDGTFSEIGQFLGIDKTDWSWAPLISDFNNDGHNDIYITNGFGQDVTDLDFVKFRQSGASTFSDPMELRKSVLDCLTVRPSIKLSNYIYENKGGLKFEKKTEKWGLHYASISNGSAYADLDLDGDLELIVNNINQPAFIYKNNTRELNKENSNYLQVQLVGKVPNGQGIGAEVEVFFNGKRQKKMLQPVRGFQSSVEKKLHFGLGSTSLIDSVKVAWTDGRTTFVGNINANQQIELEYSQAIEHKDIVTKKGTPFRSNNIIAHKHIERPYSDFDVQPLLNHGFSSQGPGMAVGDINADGLQDVFIGGAYGFNSAILVQDKAGNFSTIEITASEFYEDLGALIYDANGDGLQDIYVVSGSSERYAGHKGYQDRLYLNDSENAGTFTLGVLPEMNESTSTVVGGDYDNDGDIDLFVGGRVVPGKYPMAPKSYILENDKGQYTDVTNKVFPSLANIGMVTAAVWTDFDNDFNLDLVIVGEFMPITLLKGDGKKLYNISEQSGLSNTHGLWNSVWSDDFDNDGDIDFIVGNLGLNSPLKATHEKPLNLHFDDFDNNGFVDPILSMFEQGEYYPVASLDQLTKQLPLLKKQVLYYRDYAKSSTSDILQLLGSANYTTFYSEEMRSIYLENQGEGHFKILPLPTIAQIAPVYGILAEDIDLDGLLDVILTGNAYNTEVINGRYDASIGTVLMNKGKGAFVPMKNLESGLSLRGEAKSMVRLDMKNDKSFMLIGRNNASTVAYELVQEAIKRIQPYENEKSAMVYFSKGEQRKVEYNLGKGYLSQSAQSIAVTSEMDSIQFFDRAGKVLRTENFGSKNVNSE